MAMLKLLERMGRADLTVHGFRSTFRDWAAERTNFPNEVVEMALAHVVENKSEAATDNSQGVRDRHAPDPFPTQRGCAWLSAIRGS
jgi:integrase